MLRVALVALLVPGCEYDLSDTESGTSESCDYDDEDCASGEGGGGGGGGGGCGGTIVCNDGSCSPSCTTCSQGCCSSHGGCL